MPATSARTLSVNAAFLQEIKDDHRELHDVFARLAGQFSHLCSPVSWHEIVHLLHCLRDRLAVHFALEEAYGYCEDAIQVAPRLSNRADRLRSQHPTLYQWVHQIAEHAEQGLLHESHTVPRAQVSSEFERFVRAFEDHEQQECSLILDAYGQDLGTGD